MKDYLNRKMLIHYSEKKEPYTDSNSRFRSVLCRPNVHKYLSIKEYIKRNKVQRESFVSESNSCIGAFSSNKKEVSCKECLKKLNNNNERELKYKINMLKCRMRQTDKTVDKQQKELERLYKQIEIVTGIELKRCDRCVYFEDWNNQIYRCVNPLLGWNAPPYFLKNVSSFVDVANEYKCFCRGDGKNN